MRVVTVEELKEQLSQRDTKEILKLKSIKICNVDLKGWMLDYIDFSLSIFDQVCFDGACLDHTILENALFHRCTLRNTSLRYANMKGASLRYIDMAKANIEGANMYSSILEYANLKEIIYNDETKFFKMYCPEAGAILGYKKCMNDRLVQLLIPASAKRSSATYRSCRCNKAKVLTIKNFDYTETYEEAWSLVDENFVYRVGEWVEVVDFDENRWKDSTTGIHFWLTREEAFGY